MALSDRIKKSEKGKFKPIILLYGEPGIGKTTLGAGLEKPLFLLAEKSGLTALEDVDYIEINSWNDLGVAIKDIMAEEEIPFKTIVVDSVTILQEMLFKHIAEDAGKKSIEEIGYGKGYKIAVDYWQRFFKAVEMWSATGITVILLGHSTMIDANDSNGDVYKMIAPALHKDTLNFWYTQTTEMGYMYKPVKKQTDAASPKSNKARFVSDDRIILFGQDARIRTKTRNGFPESLPVDAEELKKYL